MPPLGQRIGSAGGLPLRVVGVVAGYRQRGELSPPQRYVFLRHRWTGGGDLLCSEHCRRTAVPPFHPTQETHMTRLLSLALTLSLSAHQV